MSGGTAPQGYSGLQIALHWIVVVLVAFQLIFGEEMGDLFRAVLRGTEPDSDAALWGNLHIWIGFAILAAVLLRLILRFSTGAPPPSEESSPMLALAAKVTHWTFYAVLVALPVTGALAYYLPMRDMGEIHEIGKPILIVLIALHVLAALWHQFVRRDGALTRIVVPR